MGIVRILRETAGPCYRRYGVAFGTLAISPLPWPALRRQEDQSSRDGSDRGTLGSGRTEQQPCARWTCPGLRDTWVLVC